MQLPKTHRRLVFYSEGKNYWPHLEGLVKEVLATSDISVSYISSGEDDPGLAIEHPNYRSFKIDEGFVRNWLFENIDADVMVMTMPDLHQYQVKKSKHKVHYVYVQHSLVSLHMVYRSGAFDYYDTIFCAGPHHIEEIRAIEEQYNLPQKNIVEHGYGRLDSIIKEAKKYPIKEKTESARKHILIAPSWGPNGTIESGLAEKIVAQLIAQDCKVTLRPHPQTVKFSKDKVDDIIDKYDKHPQFAYETNVAGQNSLHESDIMISDWSGAALDYAFGLNKPVLFIDVPRKINNPRYEEIAIEPFEVTIRNKIGKVIKPSNLNFEINDMNFNHNEKHSNIFCVGRSSITGAENLERLVDEIQRY